MEDWLKSLQNVTKLGEEELSALTSFTKPVHFESGDFFIIPDKTCSNIGVLTSGIARVYHIHDGKEITDYFNTTTRNNLVSSFASFLKQKPSREYVQFLSNSNLMVISYNDLQALYKEYKSLERLGRLMAEQNYLLALARIESLQYHNAATRYESFLELYPQLINQIPHHYVASYLGVTPESLSRIRKRFTK